jgi:hypothetical protein
MIHAFLIVCISFLVVAGSPRLSAAYEVRTHGEVTRRAYEASAGIATYLQMLGISHDQQFASDTVTPRQYLARFENTGTPRDWMIEGVIREDDYVDDGFAALLGCPRPTNPPSQVSRVLNHFFDVQRGGGGLTVGGFEVGIPGPDWALGLRGRGAGTKENQFSLPDARDYQHQSLTASSRDARDKYTALFFRALGHVLHLVEDMAQPQHTRNDPHAGCMDLLDPIFGGHSWYEHYVEDRTLRRRVYRGGGELAPEIVLSGYEVVPIRTYREFFTNPTRRGIADFSSRNFLSVGTNLGSASDPCGGLVEPPCVEAAYRIVSLMITRQTLNALVSGNVTLYTRDVFDALTGEVLRDVPLSSRSAWDQHLQKLGRVEKFSLNKFNYDAMADILLPRAVGYAAGFLDTFFRGSVSGTYEDERLRISGSPETMVGTFQLLYDGPDGTRWPLATWASLRIDPGEPSPPLSVPQLPASAPPETTPCWLIFRGQLGVESDAVVGSRAPCPPVPIPPMFGPWVLYTCVHKPYGDPQGQFRYVYATDDPPLASDGLPAPTFFRSVPTGFTACSITAQGLLEPPPSTVTEHPV